MRIGFLLSKLKFHLSVIASVFAILGTAQSSNQFLQYQNDTLLSSDKKLLEQPVRKFNAEEVLNNSIQWKNPYPLKLSSQLDGFDATKIFKVPAKGIYPRLFCAPYQFETIKSKMQSSTIGLKLRSLAKKEMSLLQEGQGVFGKCYQQLLTNKDIDIAANFPLAEFANLLAVQGLLSQLDDNSVLLKETGLVSARFLAIWIDRIKSTPQVLGKEMMVKEAVYSGAKLAKLFDFTAAGMSKQDQQAFLNFMVKETNGKFGDGMQLPHHWRRWNHIASSLAYPLSVLSIENEPGFDKRIFERGVELLKDYLSYTFTSEGMSTEGITYTFGPFADDLLLMQAVAARTQWNPFGVTNFRNIPDWLIYSLSSNPDALWTSHGDTGSASELPWTMMMILKYFFPKDEKIDYLLANCLPSEISKMPDVSIFAFLSDPDKSKQTYNGVPPVNMPLTFFSADRGSMIARNKWGKDGIVFHFDARQDTYFQSHDHSDRGNFELAANGRWWIVDGFRSTETKYHSLITIDGQGQGYFATPATWLSYTNNSNSSFGSVDYKYAFDWMWLKSPVADKMLGKQLAPQWETGVYAKVAKNLNTYYPGAKPQRDPLRKVAEYFSGSIQTNPLIWNEDTWPMRLPNCKVEYAFRTAGLVKGKHDYVLIIDDLKKDQQDHLFEWMLPMPLDVELVSIKQLVDVTQLSDPLNIGFNSLANAGIHGEYELLLGDKRMARNMKEVDNTANEIHQAGRFLPKKGDPQLLVRVLERTAAPRPNLEPNPRLEVVEKIKNEDLHQFYLRTLDLGKRLVIPSRSVVPNFKVLIFPHLSGEALPETEWNADRTILKVNFNDQKDLFYFKKGINGKTIVRLERDGQLIFEM